MQALAADSGFTDSRNWTSVALAVGATASVHWIDLDSPESPLDDLRVRGLARGALRFARGEGIYMGNGEVFFTCTSGGPARLGQIFRLAPTSGSDRLQLFYESRDGSEYASGDNLVVAPDGQLIICEDQDRLQRNNHLRGFTRDGRAYPLAQLLLQTELAGTCFSPDGRHLFVNVYSPAKTLAISGPWAHLS